MALLEDDETVLPTDDRAAYQVTITGWASRDGVFFGNGEDSERQARYHGSTHNICQDCGGVARKSRLVCDECSDAREVAVYATLPRKTWDGVTPLYSEKYEKYLTSDPVEELYYIEQDKGLTEGSLTLEDMRLLICDPTHFSQVQEDQWYELLPDGYDDQLPREMQDALDALNAVIDKQPPPSFYPSRYAMDLDAYRAGVTA